MRAPARAGIRALRAGANAHRIDIPALGLTPLRLEDHGVWDPDEEYWCEEGEPLPEWALAIIERGPRAFQSSLDPRRARVGRRLTAEAGG